MKVETKDSRIEVLFLFDLKVIDDKSSAQSSNGPAHKGCARIRWFPVMNACGDAGPVVLIISDA